MTVQFGIKLKDYKTKPKWLGTLRATDLNQDKILKSKTTFLCFYLFLGSRREEAYVHQ